MEGEGWRRYPIFKLAATGPWAERAIRASQVWLNRHPEALAMLRLIYALQNKMPYGMVKNKREIFVTAHPCCYK